jgi:hypothetical protein
LNWGHSANITAIVSNKGLGSDVVLHYSQGIFSGFSAEAAMLNPWWRVNERFYGKQVSPTSILFQEGSVRVPEGTSISELYARLDDLCHGRRRTKNTTTSPPPRTTIISCEEEGRNTKLRMKEEEEATKERRQDVDAPDDDVGSDDTEEEEQEGRYQYAVKVGKSSVLVPSN